MSIDEVNYFGSKPNLPKEFRKQEENEEPKRADNVRQLFAKDEEPRHEETRGGIKLPKSYTRSNVPRGAWVEVDLDAIAHNVQVARKHIGPARELMAVVKADAYGHGAIPVSKVALRNGATRLAVATPEEGVELREAGFDVPILMLSQPPLRTIPLLLEYDITPAVFTSDFALALGEAADRMGKVAPIHLAVDTGMNRIGVFYLDVVDFMRSIDFHRGIHLEGVFTHFATADEASDWDFRIQQRRFNEAIQSLRDAHIDPGIVHCANSASIERYPEVYFDMVRLGVTMYGMAPSPVLRDTDPLIPAMSVKAQLSYVKEPQMGEGVSYGLNYRVARPVQIGTVPLGYADGLRRELSGRMKVLVNGRLCQQVGNICMDQFMVEIVQGHSVRGVVGGAELGDEVVILGTQGDYELTADIMADEIGTINYEITCGFGLRLPKVYLGEC